MRKHIPIVIALAIGIAIGLAIASPKRRNTPIDATSLTVHMPAGLATDGKSDRVLDVYLIEEDGEPIFDPKRTTDSPPAWLVTVGNRRYFATSR